MIQPRITNGLGALTPATWNRVMAAVVDYEKTKNFPASKSSADAPASRTIFAQINGSVSLSAGRWKYAWTRVALTGGQSACTVSTDTTKFTAMSASTSDAAQSASPTWAINSAELSNTSTFQNGYVVNGTTNKIVDSGGTQTQFSVQAIQTNIIVVLNFVGHVGNSGRLQPYFTYANTVDGNCNSAFTNNDPNDPNDFNFP